MEGLTEDISADPDIRETLKKELADKGAANLYNKLKEFDPERAAELNVNDSFRIMRALEIFLTTGKVFSAIREKEKITGGDYDYFTIGIGMQKDTLNKCIEKRVDHMISEGLPDEIKSILSMGFSRDLISLDTVGYKEWFPYFDGEMSFEKCLEQVKRDTRRYAKRQMTWFRAQKNIRWINPCEPGAIESKFKEIEKWLSSK